MLCTIVRAVMKPGSDLEHILSATSASCKIDGGAWSVKLNVLLNVARPTNAECTVWVSPSSNAGAFASIRSMSELNSSEGAACPRLRPRPMRFAAV